MEKKGIHGESSGSEISEGIPWQSWRYSLKNVIRSSLEYRGAIPEESPREISERTLKESLKKESLKDRNPKWS